ncbi:multiheme c-type cytochrome [Sorangium sp. So ce131]|uniref:multiheme c-type cytochrome n=1 Tax=Sorangium sp. So ce131 TaxID=3133282 RepID=UPI003F5FD4F2
MPRDGRPPARRPAALLLAAAMALAPSATSGGRAPARMPGPEPPRNLDAAAVNRGCERCHEEIAREWRGSKHQRAYVDAPFQAALAKEPLPFCRGCHAPEARSSRPPPPELAELGVACVTCHVVDGAPLAAPAPARPGADPGPAADLAPPPARPGPGAAAAPAPPPHPVLRDARFASAAACGGCHEFAFPDSAARRAPEPMQLTLSEHAASPYAGVACARCHMPLTGGDPSAQPPRAPHASHTFASSRDPDAARRAVRIQAERASPTAARFTLRTAHVGHAFPTGDLFRRIEVRAEVLGDDYAVITSARRFLARHFATTPGPLGARARTTTSDDRPGAPALSGKPIVVELDLGPAAERYPIQYEIVYQRVAHVSDGREEEAAVESEVTLARGNLPRITP